MNEPTPSVSADRALSVIADSRRRNVLKYLAENGDAAIPIDELVAGIEDGRPLSGGDNREMDNQIVIELHHTHLPKLDEVGLIDYEKGAGTVRYRPQDDIEELIDFVAQTFE